MAAYNFGYSDEQLIACGQEDARDAGLELLALTWPLGWADGAILAIQAIGLIPPNERSRGGPANPTPWWCWAALIPGRRWPPRRWT